MLLSRARLTVFDPFDVDGSEASQEKEEIILEGIEKACNIRCTSCRLLWEDVHVIDRIVGVFWQCGGVEYGVI